MNCEHKNWQHRYRLDGTASWYQCECGIASSLPPIKTENGMKLLLPLFNEEFTKQLNQSIF